MRDALARGAALLTEASDTPRLDAELLMAHALGASREGMLLHRLDDREPEDFSRLVDRRLAGEPVAYIVGARDFWTITLAVAPGVLIPRPDSETLIEAALDHFGARGPRTVLDLGTGSGALLLAALDQWPDATGLGIDRSDEALAIASANADRNRFSGRASFRKGDWAEGIDSAFDLILCNPPYIENGATLSRDVTAHEPPGALYAGADGLDAYRALGPQFPRLIARGGMAAVEIGATQGEAASALLARDGLSAAIRRDLGGRDRCVVLKR